MLKPRDTIFRAWLANSHVPGSNEQMLFGGPDFHSLKRFFAELGAWRGKVYLSQFIGIWGANDERLFEGDVVELWSEGYKHTGVITWRDAVGGACPCYIILPAYAEGKYWHLNGGHEQGNIRLLGNIYQHKELRQEYANNII
jgi:hypothetical protein